MLPRESPVSVGLKGVVFVKCDQYHMKKFEINTLIPCVSLLLIITKLVTVEFFIKSTKSKSFLSAWLCRNNEE